MIVLIGLSGKNLLRGLEGRHIKPLNIKVVENLISLNLRIRDFRF